MTSSANHQQQITILWRVTKNSRPKFNSSHKSTQRKGKDAFLIKNGTALWIATETFKPKGFIYLVRAQNFPKNWHFVSLDTQTNVFRQNNFGVTSKQNIYDGSKSISYLGQNIANSLLAELTRHTFLKNLSEWVNLFEYFKEDDTNTMNINELEWLLQNVFPNNSCVIFV